MTKGEKRAEAARKAKYGMRLSGRSIGKIYRDAVTKRAKEATK